jgi:hypothetical protein
MADRTWGSNWSNEDLPFAHVHGHGAPGMVVGNASGGYTACGWFTMPWAGNLTVTLTAVGSWVQGGHQQWSVHLASSSPSPNSYSFMHQICINNYTTMRGQLPAYAAWANLAKGQRVDFTLYMGVGGGGHNVTLEWWGETIRAWPG